MATFRAHLKDSWEQGAKKLGSLAFLGTLSVRSSSTEPYIEVRDPDVHLLAHPDVAAHTWRVSIIGSNSAYREAGVYEMGSADGIVQKRGLEYEICVRGDTFADAHALYLAIRAGAVRPTQSWDQLQLRPHRVRNVYRDPKNRRPRLM